MVAINIDLVGQKGNVEPKLEPVLSQYEWADGIYDSEQITAGLTNETHRVMTVGGNAIVQKINQGVFHDVEGLMDNVAMVTEHIARKAAARGVPSEYVVNVVKTATGDNYATVDGGEGKKPEAWRVLTEVPDGQILNKVGSYDQAEVVAWTFGQFSGELADFPADQLHETIPDFHNTPKYFEKLIAAKENAVVNDPEADELFGIISAESHRFGLIVDRLESGEIPMRVAHNDTKANNAIVHIDEEHPENNVPIAAIDLDTVMPGSILFDFGDGGGFACNNGKEDEMNPENVHLRRDLLAGWAAGYFRGMRDRGVEFTDSEVDHMVDSIVVLRAELAMRFLADYYMGDPRFPKDENRPRHNLERARAQTALVLDTIDHKDELQEIIYRKRDEVRGEAIGE
ncbi:aminoglycoside phosphotransferase family protein [Candidatus Saccharibacteria bacterium]|nr:aminoglycoside phosphotransferase family protein [Candidatus Saccharibacteria bacterium]MCL1963289.1 aminoglycoside phosphotransferase family protein [Candidatus Saccharibacteria bacterium]